LPESAIPKALSVVSGNHGAKTAVFEKGDEKHLLAQQLKTWLRLLRPRR